MSTLRQARRRGGLEAAPTGAAAYARRMRRRHSPVPLLAAVAPVLGLVLGGCSAGEPAEPGPTTSGTPADTDAAGTDPAASPSTLTPGELTPPEILGRLLESDPEIAARVDYNTGAGTISVSYGGTQTVLLSTVGRWGGLALAACTATARYATAVDPDAAVEVRDGMPGDRRTPVRARWDRTAGECTTP